jgi:hypothetical protein
VGPKNSLDGCEKSCPQATKIDLRWNEGRFNVLRTWNVKVGDLEKAMVYLKWTVFVFDRKNRVNPRKCRCGHGRDAYCLR